MPGAVDTASGVVLRSDVLGWTDVPLGDQVAQRLGVPAFVQDVTQAATLAEARYGAALGASSALVVDYGARIGVGLVLQGRLHRGASGLAGSVGHTPAFGEATPCRCGRLGCLEAVASIRAMVPADVRRRHGPDDDASAFAEVIERVGGGDAALTSVVEAALDRGAHALAPLVALTDPEVVVLTGMIVDLPDLARAFEDRIRAVVPPEHAAGLELRRSTLGLQAWVRGAILVALQQLQPDVGEALGGSAAPAPVSPRRDR